jgi:glycosyltransferase involved in cell wall biosynthesis
MHTVGEAPREPVRPAPERAARSPKVSRKGIKIAHVTAVDSSLRYLLLNQMRSQSDFGVDVAGISASGTDVPALEEAGIRHLEVPFTRAFDPVADLKALYALWRVMRREKFTLIHTHTPKGGLLGQYAALLAGVPVRVHTIHGLYFPGHMSPRARFAYVLLERITMLFSRFNFSQNPEDMPVAVAEKITTADKLELIGNGIDISAFDPALQPPEKRAAVRAKLGLTKDHLVVGMVARLVAEKGYHEMFKAARAIKDTVPAARFIFIGGFDGNKPDAIKESTLADYGIADVAQCLGHRTDVPDLYAIMDVFALPSYREGFPRAPMEASTMGIPSIVTNVRGCRQTVEDGVNGRLIPSKDVDSLTSALLELLGDPEKRARMGAKAREKALAEFDERVVFGKILRVYEELLRQYEKGAAR